MCSLVNAADANPNSLSPSLLFTKTKEIIESSPCDSTLYTTSLSSLHSIATHLSQTSAFSKNEVLEDVQTQLLKFLAMPYFMAKCYQNLPSSDPSARLKNINNCITLFTAYINSAEKLSMLSPEQLDQCNSLIHSAEDSEALNFKKLSTGQARDAKIARYKQEKAFKAEMNQLAAVLARRKRLNVAEADDFEGGDEEQVVRELEIKSLKRFIVLAVDEILQSKQELDMLKMLCDAQSLRAHDGSSSSPSPSSTSSPSPCSNPNHNCPPQNIHLTNITQDPTTSKLIFKRESLSAGVFRPGWNLPTMTLAELGEIELAEALQRDVQHKASEAAALEKPRRYEYLVRDGLEDDHAKVDASAALDQKWDDWKDENPKGSGNKKGELGDRNF